MVSVSFHKTCYWITARSKDSLSLSHVLSFLSLLPAVLLISLSPLNRFSTLPPSPLHFVPSVSAFGMKQGWKEKRKRQAS